ncbi:hypothetical protein FFF34_012800 [Inquilinus sp. KBS0705]|nr:hypothetical protein FFF34_012800 [Inquilinus sp. KBS0705]
MGKGSILRYFMVLGLVVVCFAGCKNKVPFTPRGWDEGDGIDFPKRYMMVDDLLASGKLKGLKYKQVVYLLKAPQRNSHTDRSFSYEITRKMSGIDTLYIKNLVIYINADSVVTDAKVTERSPKKEEEQKKK